MREKNPRPPFREEFQNFVVKMKRVVVSYTLKLNVAVEEFKFFYYKANDFSEAKTSGAM